MTRQPGTRRLNQLAEQLQGIAQEVHAIEGGDLPATEEFDGEEFSHADWLYAETVAAREEEQQLTAVMTADGRIPYGDGFTDMPDTTTDD